MEPHVIPGVNIKFPKLVSPNALRALYRLHQNGFKAYLVGGCVRDLILERTPKDFDIATDATPGKSDAFFEIVAYRPRFRLAIFIFKMKSLK
jgi:poly(A) polymerase